MISDYSKDKNLFENCISFIDGIFPGCKEFSLKAMNYGASWPEASTPFIIEEKGKILAHVGILPLTININGNNHQTAGIHAVSVHPLQRGKGHFRQLMNEVISYTKINFESSFLMTQKPYLFKDFSYTTMLPEYNFVLKNNVFLPKESDLRDLELNNLKDLELLKDLLSKRLPLSDNFSLQGKNAATLFIMNSMYGKICYSEQLHTVILYKVVDNILYLNEIVSSAQYKLSEIIKLIPEQFDKVILQFCPDRYLNENEYTAVLARPENCVMVSPELNFKAKYFRYPEIYSC